MSSVTVSGNASGTCIFTIASPNSNTNRTLNLPDASGTILTTATPGVPVNGPAFSAFQNATQTIANVTNVKIQFQAEEFDTANCFDPTTNFRFTPNVAGYYQLNACVSFAGALVTSSGNFIMFWKNGSEIKRGVQSTLNTVGHTVSSVIFLNGSTDFVEVYFFQATGASQSTNSGASITWFNGALIRSAT